MALNNISLLKGATGHTITGGVATTYQDDGLEVKSGIHLVDVSEPNFLLRPHGTFKNKPATLQSTGKFSKGVRGVNFTIPFLEADGTVSYPVFRGTFDLPPTMSVAQITEMRRMAAQQILDAEADNFYNFGTIA
jgi:hypothetical protein